MKNIVFIPNIDCGNGRNKPYHYSVKSWENWAKQYDNIEIIEWTEPVFDTKIFPIIYQREWVFDILDHNEIDYDQVLIIDSDTIVHPDCPNLFEKTSLIVSSSPSHLFHIELSSIYHSLHCS